MLSDALGIHSLDSVSEVNHVEIDEQAHGEAAQFEVRDQLRLVDRSEFLDGFQLQDNRTLDQHIKPVARIQPNPVVDDGERDLGLGLQTTGFEVVNQTDPVSAFQKARPQGGVNLQGTANDLPRQLALVHGPCACSLSLATVPEWGQNVPYHEVGSPFHKEDRRYRRRKRARRRSTRQDRIHLESGTLLACPCERFNQPGQFGWSYQRRRFAAAPSIRRRPPYPTVSAAVFVRL